MPDLDLPPQKKWHYWDLIKEVNVQHFKEWRTVNAPSLHVCVCVCDDRCSSRQDNTHALSLDKVLSSSSVPLQCPTLNAAYVCWRTARNTGKVLNYCSYDYTTRRSSRSRSTFNFQIVAQQKDENLFNIKEMKKARTKTTSAQVEVTFISY